jgi:hypothetical protein
MKCKNRIRLTQSVLAPEEKVKSARGTERVKGKSYRQGPVYISNREDIGRMEVCWRYERSPPSCHKLEHEISLRRVLHEDQQTK